MNTSLAIPSGVMRIFGVLAVLIGCGTAIASESAIDLVKKGDLAGLRILVDGSESAVNEVQPDGATALHWASYRDNLEAARLLLESGAKADATNDLGVTPLLLACTNGSQPMVDLLIGAGVDVNLALPTGETPLMTAARTGNAAVVQALIDGGAEVDASEPTKGQTALMWAVAEKHPEVVRVLIENKADISQRSKGGSTPILFAARVGDVDSAEALLDAGAYINDQDRRKASVLLTAVVRGHSELAMELLERGADPNADKTGYTPLHWACGTWETEMTGPNGIESPPDHEWSALRGVQIAKHDLIRALLEHGADVNARLKGQPPRSGYTVFTSRPRGTTPYGLAAMAGDAKTMQILVEFGGDPLLASDDKTTPLMMAAGVSRGLAESRATLEDSLAAVQHAIESGGDANAVNSFGDTALHGAARIRSDDIVRLLVQQGAEINVSNERGQTPLFIAERYFHPGSAPLVERTSTGDLLRELGTPEIVRTVAREWGVLPQQVRDEIAAVLKRHADSIEGIGVDDPTLRINENPVLPKQFSPSYLKEKRDKKATPERKWTDD